MISRDEPARLVEPVLYGRRVLLVRHGESVFNRDGRFQGSLKGIMRGPRLTKLGHQQARKLGQVLQEHYGRSLANASVRVSPLRRARQTWNRIRGRVGIPDKNAEAWQELREIDLFEWEGRTMKDISTEYPEQWQVWLTEPWKMELASGVRPVQLLLARAAAVWSRLCKETPAGGTTLVVAHGGLNRAVLLKALGLPDSAYGDPAFRFPNCGAAELDLGPAHGGSGPPSALRWRWLRAPEGEPAENGCGTPAAGQWRSAQAERVRYGQRQ